MLFDTHCHLHHPRFDADRAEALARAREAGVTRLLLVGTSVEDARAALQLAEQHEGVFVAAGVHPEGAARWDGGTRRALLELCRHPKVRAIGEVGLDYHWDYPRADQERAFRAQIRLAREVGLPLVIHDRDAHADVLRVLEEEGAGEVGGILHCFSAGWPEAERGLSLGFALGIGGPVTYPRNDALRAVVRQAPAGRLVLETDSPYLPPQARRGQRNEPAFVRFVAEAVATERGLSFEEVARLTSGNGARILRLDGAP